MPARKIAPFWEHQSESVKFATRRKKAIFDMSDPGTGKTRVHLELWWRRRKKGGGCLLVIAPKTLLKTAWADDIRSFLPLIVTYSIARSNNRDKAFDIDTDVYITNTDGVKWLAKQRPSFFKKFDTVIIDEVTAFKHRSSGRSRAMGKIKQHFLFRTGLTGTPNSNTNLDLWNQMMILDDGKLLGKAYTQFRNVVCQYVPGAFGGKWVDKPKAEEAIARKLAPLVIRHDFDDCMDIPKNHMYKKFFDMSPANRRAYDKMMAEAILWLEEQGTVSAVNEGVLRNKLLQISSGAVYGDDDKDRRRDPTYKLIDRDRYALVGDLVEAREYSIVFFNWKHQREELKIEFDRREIKYEIIDGNTPDGKREEIVEAYQDGAYQTLAMHPKTGAHGLTLTRGRATIVTSPFYEADFLKQAKHRIHRGGQRFKTETILIEARDTIESQVYARLKQKTKRMETLLSMLLRSK